MAIEVLSQGKQFNCNGVRKRLSKGIHHLGIWPAPLGVPGEDGAGTALAGALLLAGSF